MAGKKKLTEKDVPRLPPPFGLHRYLCDCDVAECNSRGSWLYVRAGPNDSFQIRSTFYEQKGKAFIHGHLPGIVMDAMSIVPAIDDRKDYSDMAQDFLDKTYAKWQRPLDLKRIEDEIGEWWSEEEAYISNSIVLGMNECRLPTTITKTDVMRKDDWGKCELVYDSWLHDKCLKHGDILNALSIVNNDRSNALIELLTLHGETEFFADYCPVPNCSFHIAPLNGGGETGERPFHIIDGQHRTRGSQSGKSRQMESEYTSGCCGKDVVGHDADPLECMEQCGKDGNGKYYWIPNPPATHENLPYTMILHEDIGGLNMDHQATVFQQITTKGVELQSRHKAFLLWKFLDNGQFKEGYFKNKEINFIENTAAGKKETWEHAYYEAILELISSKNAYIAKENNVLGNSIAPIIDHSENNQILRIDEMFDFMENYHTQGPLSTLTTLREIAVCVARYFSAIAYVWRRPVLWGKGQALEHGWEGDDSVNPWDWFWAPSHPDYDPFEFSKIPPAKGSDKGIITHSSNSADLTDTTVWMHGFMACYNEVASEAIKLKWQMDGKKLDDSPATWQELSDEKYTMMDIGEDIIRTILERVHADFKFNGFDVKTAKTYLKDLLIQSVITSSPLRKEIDLR